MPCIEPSPLRPGPATAPGRLALGLLALGALLLLGACGSAPRTGVTAAPVPAPPAAPQPPAVPAAPAPPPAEPVPARPAPAATPQPQPGAAGGGGPVPRQPRYVQLPPPPTPRSLDDLQRIMARRLVEAHPDTSYTRRAPPRLLAIPVIEVELNADGSVRSTRVLRRPSTGDEATALAIAAIRRAAPYGNVSRLPRPWKVVETFLFDDELRFKPRTLDLD